MTTDLFDLLSPVTEAVDNAAPTITIGEITSRLTTQPPLIDGAPPAPVELDEQRLPRRIHGFVVGVSVAAAVIAGLVVVVTRDTGPTEILPPAESGQVTVDATAATAIPPPDVTSAGIATLPSASVVATVPTGRVVTVPFNTDEEVVPTLLEPQALPAGVQFVQGGTVQSGSSPSVDMWTPDLVHWFSIAWLPQSMCGQQTSEANPFGSIASTVEIAISEMESTGTGAEVGDIQLRWCDGTVLVSVDGRQVTGDEIASLARTVEMTDDAGSFTVPAGFQYRLTLLNVKNSALVYANGETTLRVLSFASSEGEFEVLQRGMRDSAGVGAYPVEPFEVEGRPALWRFGAQLAILYDDHTVAYIDGVGLTDQDLLDAAASLTPADPALAPTLAGDCDVLSICG